MKTVAILHDVYYNFENGRLRIGGIENYIDNLVTVCREIGLHPVVYQMGETDNSIVVEGCEIVQFKVKTGKFGAFARRVVRNRPIDLAIYATDRIIPRRNPFANSIAVQHGIYWDMPRPKKRRFERVVKSVRNRQIVNRISRVKTLVCADYNFINWLRAETDKDPTRIVPILNFARIDGKMCKKSGEVSIIFARRLWQLRGTRVFVDAVKPILERYPHVKVTVAGDGPDLEYMQKALAPYGNVIFTTYKAAEAVDMHRPHHIAVVPTVFSEATSLSLLEAMAAGCAVVTTYVGGITNIIIDNFNGLFAPPGDAEMLSQAIERLVKDVKLRETLAANAYSTVSCGFSYARWNADWEKVLKREIQNIDNQ